ncbi:MAG: FAD binding domain-containing protein [Spirochaetaceae bacterium]|jgi:CO/xanthine dehydrogenase FAD-binding subunit|nr:FAD binding domain-containing protein [Spirochaetaceae bacterium]
MPSAPHKIFYPASNNELLAEWNRTPDAALFSGSAGWLKNQPGWLFSLPEMIISLDNIEEQRKIDRTERYLEFGSMVTLNKLLTLGKIVPEALVLALKSTATTLLRNLITLGSCICRDATPEPVVAALVALDARYELRTAVQARWITATQFSIQSVEKILKPNEFLSRIRIPLENWDYTLCRDFSAKESGDNGNEFAVFLAHIQKDILVDVRLIFSGTTILRDKNSELTLIGSKLPLDKRTCESFVNVWQNHLGSIDGRSDFQKAKLLNFLEQAILYFAY